MKRDLGTLVHPLELVERSDDGEKYRASDLSPPEWERVKPVLKELGARPDKDKKELAAAKLAGPAFMSLKQVKKEVLERYHHHSSGSKKPFLVEVMGGDYSKAIGKTKTGIILTKMFKARGIDAKLYNDDDFEYTYPGHQLQVRHAVRDNKHQVIVSSGAGLNFKDEADIRIFIKISWLMNIFFFIKTIIWPFRGKLSFWMIFECVVISMSRLVELWLFPIMFPLWNKILEKKELAEAQPDIVLEYNFISWIRGFWDTEPEQKSTEKKSAKKPLPDGSPYKIFEVLRTKFKGKFVTAEEVRKLTKGRAKDGHLSSWTMQRDLGTLVHMGIVEVSEDGEKYRASDLSPPEWKEVSPILEFLGIRPSEEKKMLAAAMLAGWKREKAAKKKPEKKPEPTQQPLFDLNNPIDRAIALYMDRYHTENPFMILRAALKERNWEVVQFLAWRLRNLLTRGMEAEMYEERMLQEAENKLEERLREMQIKEGSIKSRKKPLPDGSPYKIFEVLRTKFKGKFVTAEEVRKLTK
ncbi:MAG: hypothetical protein ACE5JK_08440, partial [Candidatus Omnitrophota bacterium]